MRILALDYGRKRIGIALSDPLFMTAQPHGFILNDSKFMQALHKLILDSEVSEIVIGYPQSMSGNANEMTKEVDSFVVRLKKEITLPIHLSDERLTTLSAERLLIEGNVRREKRKDSRDMIAASLILQNFLKTRG